MSHTFINRCIALIWIVNGLICKVLHLVPRHEQIVARILGASVAPVLTVLIGLGEVALGLWVLAGKYTRQTAWIQMLLIGTMNILEFTLAPDLLLWGRLNIIFAAALIGIIYYNEYRLK